MNNKLNKLLKSEICCDTNSKYPMKAYFRGHSGTHIKDGVYKVDKPYREYIMRIFNPDTADYLILASKDELCNEDDYVVEYFKEVTNLTELNKLFKFNKNNLNNKLILVEPHRFRGELFYE